MKKITWTQFFISFIYFFFKLRIATDHEYSANARHGGSNYARHGEARLEANERAHGERDARRQLHDEVRCRGTRVRQANDEEHLIADNSAHREKGESERHKFGESKSFFVAIKLKVKV